MQGLAFHSFVHYFEEIRAEQQTDGRFIHDCVKAYLKIYTDAVYRGDDTVDCETPKIHAHLHLAGDIMDFGHPMNWDAGKGERGLKDWAKVVSSTAQKQNLSDFTYQTAMRIADCALLSRVQQDIKKQQPIKGLNPPFQRSILYQAKSKQLTVVVEQKKIGLEQPCFTNWF